MSQANRARPVPQIVNRVWSYFIRLGLAPKSMHLLTIRGRKTGQQHTTVVALVSENGQQFLVSPYGEMNWVQNARVAQQVSLRHGNQEWTARIDELPPAQSGTVLKKYLAEHFVTRAYFEARADSPVEAFEQEAARHPVFLLHRI
jgi:deazaflavin-dependent oxidoreductase (nitroreductase family)